MRQSMIKFLAIALFLAIGSTQAEPVSRLELRVAGFYPSSHLFRDIYGKSGIDYQIQAATQWWDCAEVWANLDWFSKKGHSIGLDDPTRIEIANASLGLNGLYQWDCATTLYLGAGFSFGKVWIKDHLFYGTEKRSKTVYGGVVKAGLYYQLTDCVYVDLFIDYLYEPVHFEKHINIGGFKPGIGLGYTF